VDYLLIGDGDHAEQGGDGDRDREDLVARRERGGDEDQ